MRLGYHALRWAGLNAGRTPSVLVIAPTRELAVQIAEVLESAGKPIGVTTLCVYGGVPKQPQVWGGSHPSHPLFGPRHGHTHTRMRMRTCTWESAKSALYRDLAGTGDYFGGVARVRAPAVSASPSSEVPRGRPRRCGAA